METEELVFCLMEFAEENWSSFVYRLQERGYTEEQAEEALAQYRRVQKLQ